MYMDVKPSEDSYLRLPRLVSSVELSIVSLSTTASIKVSPGKTV